MLRLLALRCLVFLVEHDLDLMLADKNGAMPLHIASVKNHLNCVRFIVQQGCPIDTAQPDGKTAAHIVRELKKQKSSKHCSNLNSLF